MFNGSNNAESSASGKAIAKYVAAHAAGICSLNMSSPPPPCDYSPRAANRTTVPHDVPEMCITRTLSCPACITRSQSHMASPSLIHDGQATPLDKCNYWNDEFLHNVPVVRDNLDPNRLIYLLIFFRGNQLKFQLNLTIIVHSELGRR